MGQDNDQTVPIVEVNGFKVFAYPHYASNILEVLTDNRYEGGERNVLPLLIEPGDRVLEIGSAIGVLAMVSASIVGQENVICFEANPKLIADAKLNHFLNGFEINTVNCVLQNRVIWEGSGTLLPFYVREDFWASSLMHPVGSIETIYVPTKCLEEQIEQFGANVLVCDIEGGEVELLEHADLTGINKILMEIHYSPGREVVNRMLRKLILSGFNFNLDLTSHSIVTLHRGLSFPIPKISSQRES
ncbi:MAG: FkbM family methyltransferase [Acidocella sp.]|nr:FkbM family methyltransferase [Acidocella sp.]